MLVVTWRLAVLFLHMSWQLLCSCPTAIRFPRCHRKKLLEQQANRVGDYSWGCSATMRRVGSCSTAKLCDSPLSNPLLFPPVQDYKTSVDAHRKRCRGAMRWCTSMHLCRASPGCIRGHFEGGLLGACPAQQAQTRDGVFS